MPTAAPRPRPAPDNPARTPGAFVGLLVFLVGVALLGYVFVTARALFDQPPTPLPDTPPAPTNPNAPQPPSATLVLGGSLADFLKRLLVLFVMCVAGSLIAGQGVNLFFKAIAAAPGHTPAPPAPMPTQEPPQAPPAS